MAIPKKGVTGRFNSARKSPPPAAAKHHPAPSVKAAAPQR